jgi:chromosome segregation ATPase
MKSIGQVIAMLAVIHVLGVLGVGGWLAATNRLSRDRIVTVGDTFRKTVAQEKEEKKKAELVAKDADAHVVRVEGGKAPPESAAEKLATERQRNEVNLRKLERTQADVEALRRQLSMEQEKVKQEHEALIAERKSLEKKVKEYDARFADAGFKKTVSMYDSLPAKQVKAMLSDLMTAQKTDEVVDYLGAMQPRKAAAVLKEFKSAEEVARAVKITEQLRARGKTLISPDPAAEKAAPAKPESVG